MNTYLFETCQKQYNLIKSLMEKVCSLLVLLTYVSKDVRTFLISVIQLQMFANCAPMTEQRDTSKKGAHK
jgi:hypothetical protein